MHLSAYDHADPNTARQASEDLRNELNTLLDRMIAAATETEDGS